MSYSDFYRNAEKMILAYGRTVLTVGASAFSYTIGNTRKGLPELLLAGPAINPVQVKNILNDLSEKMIERGRAFDEGEKISLGGTFPVCVYSANDDLVRRDFTVQVPYVLGCGDDYRVMQVVFCDAEGRFPWDAGCAEPYASVKILRGALS